MAGLFFERKKKCLEDGSCDGQPCGKHNLLSRNCQHARSPRQQRGSGPEQYCDANLAKSTTRKAKIKTKETKKKSVTNSFLPRERERERERESGCSPTHPRHCQADATALPKCFRMADHAHVEKCSLQLYTLMQFTVQSKPV